MHSKVEQGAKVVVPARTAFTLVSTAPATGQTLWSGGFGGAGAEAATAGRGGPRRGGRQSGVGSDDPSAIVGEGQHDVAFATAADGAGQGLDGIGQGADLLAVDLFHEVVCQVLVALIELVGEHPAQDDGAAAVAGGRRGTRKRR